jgi:hypothetical protein
LTNKYTRKEEKLGGISVEDSTVKSSQATVMLSTDRKKQPKKAKKNWLENVMDK